MIAFLLLAAQGESQLSQIAKTFGVDWPHLGAQIVSFGIVCGVLYLFAYKRVLAMLEERRSQIAHGLANAEKIKAELDKTEAMRQEVMTKAYAEAAKFIEDARAAAARVQQQETQKAISAAEQLLAKAREAAAQEHDRMLADLKREVGHLVVQATASVTGKILTPDDQRRLSEETARAVAA
ncbi:MAG TPA: ATP synthase F0 subunit B [Bryobacteraceae bacterium]|jgi:F-type H+-transporting ATPase subunit b